MPNTMRPLPAEPEPEPEQVELEPIYSELVFVKRGEEPEPIYSEIDETQIENQIETSV